MTTIFFYVLLFQIKDWDKICEEEGKMTSPIICYILLGVILFIILFFIFTNDDLTALFPRQVREQDSFNSPINQ